MMYIMRYKKKENETENIFFELFFRNSNLQLANKKRFKLKKIRFLYRLLHKKGNEIKINEEKIKTK